MLLRYDFLGDKLDLSLFRKQAKYYMSTINIIDYNFYCKNYKIDAYINKIDDYYNVDFSIIEYEYDNFSVIQSKVLAPRDDLKFKNIRKIIEYFPQYSTIGHFKSYDVNSIIDSLSDLIKMIYKINSMLLLI